MNELCACGYEAPLCTCGHRAWSHGSQSGFPAQGEPCHAVESGSHGDCPCKGYEPEELS